MTTSHGRRIQGRRALAIMAWVSLVIIAGLLWYGQEEGVIRIQAWEPAALLLTAYSAFLAIFGWLLFAAERKSSEESPALFFSGMLTLIPPCFIAYHLMPPSSPLRGWLTLGVFVFGLFAILSPLPAEVFAVPRDRKSYLQPLTDCYLSVLDVEEPQLDLQSLVPRSYYALTTPDVTPTPTSHGGTVRDPWTDPFYGTGRAMSTVGSVRRLTYSESRSRGSDVRSNSSLRREHYPHDSQQDATDRDERHRYPVNGDQTQVEHRDPSMPQTRAAERPPGLGYPAPPVIAVEPTIQRSSGLSRPPVTARSAFAPRESRAPNYQPKPIAYVTDRPSKNDPLATSVSTTAPRRPLTEPGTRTTPPVGFQSLPSARPITSSPPPASSYLPPTPSPVSQRSLSETSRATSSHVAPAAKPVFEPHVPSPVPLEFPSRSSPSLPDPSLGLGAIAAATPLASVATYDDILKSAVSEFRSITDPVPRPQEPARPLSDSESRSSRALPTIMPPDRAPETDIRELDRRIRELEAIDEQEKKSDSESAVQSASSPATLTSRLNDVKMERLKDEHGGEMIDGTIRVFFDVGQKRAHLHVPFSPPLPGLPEVECEAVSDDSVRCKVAVRQPYGIRIEARRSDASRALNAEVGFAAVYTPVRRG